MCWHIKLIMAAFCFGLFLTGANSYTMEVIDRTGLANSTQNLVVIKGKIRSIDLFRMEIMLDGCALLENKPLKLSRDTAYYLGTEEDDVNSIRGGTRFTENDKISLYELEAGHTIKCNYEIKDGEFWAVRIVRIFSHVQHILF